MKRFTSLNDAAQYSPVLAAGETEIWYYRNELSRDISFGLKFCIDQGILIDVNALEKTHIRLGCVAGKNLEELFMALMGETYSPNAEANNLIASLGLGHTSMSIGDIVKVDGKVFFCDRFGFTEMK